MEAPFLDPFGFVILVSGLVATTEVEFIFELLAAIGPASRMEVLFFDDFLYDCDKSRQTFPE